MNALSRTLLHATIAAASLWPHAGAAWAQEKPMGVKIAFHLPGNAHVGENHAQQIRVELTAAH